MLRTFDLAPPTAPSPTNLGQPVGICGTFDVENYGDLLFPLIAQRALALQGVTASQRIFSPTAVADAWPFRVEPSAGLEDAVPDLAAMLLGGGQLVRFDARYPVALPGGTFAPDAYLFKPAALCLARGVPLIWNAIGAWTASPRDPAREAILRRLLEASALVAVRDRASHAFLTAISHDAAIKLVPDTAFALSRLWPGGDPSSEHRAWLAAQAIDGPYVVVQADRRLLPHLPAIVSAQSALDARVVVLPVCRCHGDRAEHFPALAGDTDRAGGWPHPHRIREIVAGARLVVATSLHACITALSYGVPVARLASSGDRKYELLGGFEGIADLTDQRAIARLIAREPGIEAGVITHQDRLDRYWRKVAEIIDCGIAPRTENIVQWPASPEPPTPGPLASGRAFGRRLRDAMRAPSVADSQSARAQADGATVLRMERLSTIRLHTDPFSWGNGADHFSSRNAAALAAEWPETGFKTITHADATRDYRYKARSLIHFGADRATESGSLSPVWRALAADLLSREYRAAMAQLIGLDLTHAPLEANLTAYGPGHWLSPHVDLKEKLVTQIFYFNEDWRPDDGGLLEILRGSDDTVPTGAITPLLGSSAVLIRAQRSWHRVTKVNPAITRTRRSLNVIFHLPGSRSSMWPRWPAWPLASRLANRLGG